MNAPDLLEQRTRWIDAELSGPLPAGIATFHFNLYERPATHDLEIVGAPTFDPDNADWACDDVYVSGRPRFQLPHAVVGSSWEEGLDSAIRLLRSFVSGDSPGAGRLRDSQAVSAGFVDGELHVLWLRGDD